MKRSLSLLLILLCANAFVWAQNKALKCSGNQSYMSLPHFSVPESVTVEAWIKTTHSGKGTIVSWKNPDGNGDGSLFRINNGTLEYGEWMNGSSWKKLNSTASVNSGFWTHVAIVRHGSQATCFVNGIESGKSELHATPQGTTTELKVGGISTDWSESFIGEIDEVRIWNIARSAEEINLNYHKELNGDESGLIGYWQFDGNALDKTSNGRNGTLTNASYVPSDIFNVVDPDISALSFIENNSQVPAVSITANQAGVVYWAILPSSENAPSESELSSGDPRFTMTGNQLYAAVNLPQSFQLIPTLSKDSKYKLHAILRGSLGGFSPVYSSEEFTFEGLSALPQGWLNQDIGATGAVGSATSSENVYTLNGAGSDIWNASDAFQFAFTHIEGDIEISAKVKITQNIDNWTKVGLMLRNSSEAGSPNVFVCTTPENGINAFGRYSSGSATTLNGTVESIDPCYLKLVRKGKLVAAFFSADGSQWEKVGTTFELALSNKLMAGLVVCSHAAGQIASAEFDQLIITTPDPDLNLSDKGVYFSKKVYDHSPIPLFANEKQNLPEPVIDGNADWVNMYYKAWEIAFKNMRAPQNGSPFVSNWYDEAFSNDIFQWDMIFMTHFGRYAHHIFPGIQSFDNFYCRQHLSGFITREINEATGADVFPPSSSNSINPPIFSWAEVKNFELTGDKSRFEQVLPVLEKYYEYVEANRNGKDTPHKLYWSNGQASGMDNTPRDEGRPGGHYATDHQGWVDMSSQMVIQCNNIALICEELGLTEKAETYKAKAQEIADNIQQWMWNEEDGFFYDVNVNGQQNKWKTIASFWPMLANITTPEQDAKLVAHLSDPNSFWRDIVFPSLAADQEHYHHTGGYWQGAVWAPTNYATIKGLEQRGQNQFAHIAGEKYVNGVYQVYKQTGTFWENYAADKVNGDYKYGTNESNIDPCRRDFVGWTGLAPISVLIENVLGFRVNGVKKHLIFDLRRTDRHGIKRLRMNDITTTVISDERTDTLAATTINVNSDKPYKLEVWKNGKKYLFDVVPGDQQFFVEASTNSIQQIDSEAFSTFFNSENKSIEIKGDFSKGGDVSFELFDIMGKKWMHHELRDCSNKGFEISLNRSLSNLNGLFLIRLTSDGKSWSKKIKIEL